MVINQFERAECLEKEQQVEIVKRLLEDGVFHFPHEIVEIVAIEILSLCHEVNFAAKNHDEFPGVQGNHGKSCQKKGEMLSENKTGHQEQKMDHAQICVVQVALKAEGKSEQPKNQCRLVLV
jgi:hypothetical protein